METDVAEVPRTSGVAKVSSSICSELTKLLDTVCSVLPAIESAKPGHTSGIQQLCALNNSIDKTRLLLQHCTESSKLYLAITTEATLLRCERIRNSFIQSFFQVQNMVPQFLTFKIAEVLEYLRAVKFRIDCAEKEAGRALLALIQHMDSSEAFELDSFQIAASKLELTTPKAILIEKRSVKKLLDKFRNSETTEEKVLEYFLYLLQKHGNNFRKKSIQFKENGTKNNKKLASNTTHACNANILDKDHPSDIGEAVTDESGTIKLSEELSYPISLRSMDLDITSNIPMKGFHPNFYLMDNVKAPLSQFEFNNEDSFSKEYPHSNSMSSLEDFYAELWDGQYGDYFLHSNISFIWCDVSYDSDTLHSKGIKQPKDKNGHLFCWREDSKTCQSHSTSYSDKYMRFLYSLLELPIDARKRAIEDQKKYLQSKMENSFTMHSNGFLHALIMFLKNAHDLSDVEAKKTAIQLFLAVLSNNRVKISSLSEDVFEVLISLLDSEIAKETLMILQNLIQHESCRSMTMPFSFINSISKLLDSDNLDILEPSLKLLVELSTHKVAKLQIISTGCITKLSSFLTDERLEESCLQLLHHICDVEEGASLITRANGCISWIAELLENSSDAKRTQAAVVLYSICSQSLENCLLVLEEGVIPALVHICATGNDEGIEISSKLLHLLRDASCGDGSANSFVKP